MGADIAIYHFGIVDCWIRAKNSVDYTDLYQLIQPEEFKEVIEEILAVKKDFDESQPCFFIGILPTNDPMLQRVPQQNKAIEDFNNAIKEALKYNCHFIDMKQFLEDNGEEIAHPDGKHLTNSGHEKLAILIHNKFKELDLN